MDGIRFLYERSIKSLWLSDDGTPRYDSREMWALRSRSEALAVSPRLVTAILT